VRESAPDHIVEWGAMPPRPQGPIDVTGGGGIEVKPNEAALNALLRVIQKVEGGVPSLPSICLYTLQNNNQGINGFVLTLGNYYILFRYVLFGT